MAKKRRAPAKRVVKRAPAAVADIPASTSKIPAQLQEFLEQTSIPKGFVNPKQLALVELRKRVIEINLRPTVPLERLLASVNRIKPAPVPEEKLPEEIKASVRALKPELRRFHGAKIALSWFPFPCADFFLCRSIRIHVVRRHASSDEVAVQCRDAGAPRPTRRYDGRPRPRSQLGSHNPADAGVSSIPAGFTYFGQFVDHDITFDVSSSLDVATDANTINNMRSPSPGSGFCVRSRTRLGPLSLRCFLPRVRPPR